MKKFLLTFFLLSASQSAIAAEKWKITSLEWPPYTGKNLPEGGAAIAVLRSALKTQDIELIVEFYPWSRAKETAKNITYAGFYPAWPEEVTRGFIPSITLFYSPVGFVERKKHPLVWNTLTDLNGKSIGIVQDYGNTIEFNELVKNGKIKSEISTDDLTNIRKVAANRMDAALIDLNNLEYLLKYYSDELPNEVQANKKILANKKLLFAVNSKYPQKNTALKIKQGMSKIDADKIINDYKAKYLQ